jgi:hypothetical protein
MGYRIYAFRADGHVSPPLEMPFEDDDSALQYAESCNELYGYELWHRCRMVISKRCSSPAQMDQHDHHA